MHGGGEVESFLIVAEDGNSWTSDKEQSVWDAEQVWCDGYYSIFKFKCGVFNGGELHGQPYLEVFELKRYDAASHELHWEKVKEAKEMTKQ